MKTLGLDLGTNSIGWAVVETTGRQTKLIDKGVYLFPKGVGEEKNNEYSLAAQRSTFRAARRLKMRRRWRKQATLETLVTHDLCPGLTVEDVIKWKDNRHAYPASPIFRDWLNTKAETADGKPAGPYYCRWRCATEELDLSKPEDRYCLGRAFYHLAQRRGYKSNRISEEEKDGVVNGEIEKLNEAMGNRTLGQYYYEDCLGKEAVRGSQHYTSRKQYEDEFHTICTKQSLDAELVKSLEKNLFMQRPLRSQKGTVGKCVFERSKARASDTHPLSERFRILQVINNIRVAEPGNPDFRCLNEEEREKAIEWLAKQEKATKFDALAKQIAPKRVKLAYGKKAIDDKDLEKWRFNYRGDTGLPKSPFTGRMIKLFGSNWQEALVKQYNRTKGKTFEQIVDDVWHAIFSFDDEAKLQQFAMEHLELSEAAAMTFAKPLSGSYGMLSLAAMRRIVPFMEQGMGYSHAVFLAKLPDLLKNKGVDWEAEQTKIARDIDRILACHRQTAWGEKAANGLIHQFRENNTDPSSFMITDATRLRFRDQVEDSIQSEAGQQNWQALEEEERETLLENCMNNIIHWTGQREGFVPVKRLDERVKDMLAEQYLLTSKELEKLYHPSEAENYPAAEKNNEGVLQLGSPRIDSIKNPVFMRAMFQLRRVINTMLREGLIDGETKIRIEMARELNTANMRAAIDREQREREKERARIRTEIEALPNSSGHARERDILKYMLWEEQDHKCLYTGATIEVSAFIGDNPAYDIEHTIPRSRRLDNAQTNLTLCDRHFNRTVKRNRLPAELPQAEDIQQRVSLLFDEKIEALQKAIEKGRSASKSATDKTSKDSIRQKLHYNQIKLRSLKAKRDSFFKLDVPEGFTNSQLVDTRLICKYAMQYLKTAFSKVYSVKAGALNAVKDIWGLNDKDRADHAHHAIDAIIAACLSPKWYPEIAEYFHQHEQYLLNETAKPQVPQPWQGFDRDLNEHVMNDLLVVHYAPDNLLKQTKKVVRRRGKIVYGQDGQKLYTQGDTARGSLHQDTIYGKIKDPAEQSDGKPGAMKVVVRRMLDKSFKDFDKIVDPQVRQKVIEQKEALKNDETVWFDEANHIPIRKVRCYARPQAGNLITLNAHRDQSIHDYKQHRYAANDGNYITALYRGEIKGKLKADWKVVNNFEAIQAAKNSDWSTVMPDVDDKGLPLRHILKKNSIVIFKKSDFEDLSTLLPEELASRMYRVSKMSGKQMNFVFHRCGLTVGEIDTWPSKYAFESQSQNNGYLFSVNGIYLAVEGQDFELDALGHIHWIEEKRHA